MKFYPCCGAEWTKIKNGLFDLDAEFYAKSGGIFERSEHYSKLVDL